jgi:HEAT repeat protein
LALEVVGYLGWATPPVILERLADLLEDPGPYAGLFLGAVARIGPAAATPAIVERLTAMLAEEYPCDEAVEAVGHLGAAAATPAILDHLARLLFEGDRLPDDNSSRRTAQEAVGRLGTAAAAPAFLRRLAALLTSPARERFGPRSSAVETVRCLGTAAATPDFLEQLAALLTADDRDVRKSAVEALWHIGPAAATPPILDRVVSLLHEVDDRLVSDVLRVVARRLGPRAATGPVLASLITLLAEPSPSLRTEVAQALGELGPAAGTRAVLGRLIDLLADPDQCVRAAAARAVGQLGSAVSLDDVDRLEAMLGAGGVDAPLAASSAVKHLTETSPPSIRERLPTARALALLTARYGTEVPAGGTRAPRALSLDRLARQLADTSYDDDSYRGIDVTPYYSAVVQVRRLGAAAATQPVLDALADHFTESDAIGRSWAAWAVEALVEQGVRLFVRSPAPSLRWVARTIDELSALDASR